MQIEIWQIFVGASIVIGIGIWVGSVTTNQKNFREFMIEVRDDIKKILLKVSGEATSSSPIRLTELGEAMSKTFRGKDWATEKANVLSDRVKDKEAYEIQEFCQNYVRNELKPDEELDARIGRCAYEHGVTREQVLNVLAVELRDILLGKEGKGPMP